ncbi:HlyD family secretion protein [Thermosynechococcus sp. FA-CM-4201]
MKQRQSLPSGDLPTNSVPPQEVSFPDQQVTAAENGTAPLTGAMTEVLPDTSPQARSKRKVVGFVIGAIAMVFGSMIGWRWWQFQSTHVSTENAQIAGHISPISAKISAKVERVLVNEGDQVQAGQPLVILEDQDLTLRQQQAEAALVSAQAQLESASHTVSITSESNPLEIQQAEANVAASESAVRAAQTNVAQAQAQIMARKAAVAQAKTELDKTRSDFQRYQSLYQAGVIPAQQFDSVRAAYESAQAALTVAQQNVLQAQAQFRNAQAQLQTAIAQSDAAKEQLRQTQIATQKLKVQQAQQQQAQAQVKQATAALALANQQLSYTVIKAPLSGTVGQLTAQVGQRVQPAQPLLAIVPLKTQDVYVEANFKETDFGRLRIGQRASVELDAYPGVTFKAKIVGMSPATGASFALIPPDNATGNFNKVVQWVPVRLVFDPNTDPQHRLRPGLSATVTVDLTSAPPTAH